MRHITIFMIALVLGLAIRRQPHRRASRSISTLAPIYPTLKHHVEEGTDYKLHNDAWITFVRQAVQPGMTELEAKQVAEIILTHQPFPGDDLGAAFARLTSPGAPR